MTTTQLAPSVLGRWGWQEQAACRTGDPEAFFGREGEPRRDREERQGRALAVCARCPVREPCLRQALAVPERYGVWGGSTEEEREERRRAGRRAA